MPSNSEKKEKSLAEFVVIIALVGIMMAVFINFYIKNEDQFTQAGFATIAQSFNTKVNAVHAQWMMDKQPSVVYLASFNKAQKQAVPVNKAGWIDLQQTPLSCEAIWQIIIEIPLSAMKFPISAIEVHTSHSSSHSNSQDTQNSTDNNECRYVLLDGSYFQYSRTQGKVSKVIRPN